MKFLQELKSLHEGAVKGALEDAIAATIERLPVALLKQPYDEVVRQIAQKVQEKNPGVDIDLLVDMVKTQFEPDDLDESVSSEWEDLDAEDMYDYAVQNLSGSDLDALDVELRGLHLEDVADHEEAIQIMSKFLHANLSEAADGNWPKLIAHADEFRVEMDEDEQVHILDGEGAVRVSMPLIIWKQLCR